MRMPSFSFLHSRLTSKILPAAWMLAESAPAPGAKMATASRSGAVAAAGQVRSSECPEQPASIAASARTAMHASRRDTKPGN